MVLSLLTLGCSLSVALAACPINVQSSLPPPVVAKGYAARLVTSSLNDPRGIIFDSAGHLLVVDRGVGIKSLTLDDRGGACVGVASTKLVVDDTSLNHGIELSPNNKILYASNVESVYSYPYAAGSATATTGQRMTLVNNMTNDDHVTRTLLLSKKVPNTLLVSRGSDANIDPIALNKASGHAQLKRFDLASRGSQTYDYASDGEVVGWGIRNEVGIAEHPVTGGIYGVENSVDNMVRDGVDIHNTNPGEKLNFFGYLDRKGPSPNYGGNFGYPICFGAYDLSVIPKRQGITVGSNFAIGDSTPAKDAACRNKHVAPRNVFSSHQAPLDIKFGSGGHKGWVSFHGSYDRAVTTGYKVCYVPFNATTGDPLPPSTSKGACTDVVTNKNTQQCTGNGNCFRPVAMAFDKKGRLFFTSDATGSLYVITSASGGSVEAI